MANALPLFADHGYSGVSMRAIAAAAGLTIGTLYHYFSNKEALYLGVLQASYASCAEQWQTIFDAPTPPWNGCVIICSSTASLLQRTRNLLAWSSVSSWRGIPSGWN